MLKKSLPLIIVMLFVFAGSVTAATSVADKCHIGDLDASPNIFSAGQSINFKIAYTCQIEIDNVDIEIIYIKGGTQDPVAEKFGAKLNKGSHAINLSGNGFKGGTGTFRVIFKKQGQIIASKSEETVCKSWSIGKH
jgi:hypothetical protein